MKKEYQKPVIFFESFTLSTNIAGDCDKKTNTPAAEMCGILIQNVGMIFLSKENGCNRVVDDGEYNICYHVPTDQTQLFNS